MKASTTVVYVVGMILLASVIMFALARKANVKAGGQIGGGSFFIEATGPQK